MAKKINLTLSEFIVASIGIPVRVATEMQTEVENGTYKYGEAHIVDMLIRIHKNPASGIYEGRIIKNQLETALDVAVLNLVEDYGTI